VNKNRTKTDEPRKRLRKRGGFTYRARLQGSDRTADVKLGMIMNFTMRRESRKDVGRRAWLDIGDGGPLQVCTLIDISPSGAKLAIDDAAQVPQTFRLHLTRDGHPDFPAGSYGAAPTRSASALRRRRTTWTKADCRRGD
jgi:hypothetical protein